VPLAGAGGLAHPQAARGVEGASALPGAGIATQHHEELDFAEAHMIALEGLKYHHFTII